MRTTIISLAILFSSVLPSYSDWHPTKWGMSKDELKSLYGIKLSIFGTEESKNKTIDTVGVAHSKTLYEVDGIKFDEIFYFRNEKLSGVSLKTLKPEDYFIVERKLNLIYGKPVFISDKKENDGFCRRIEKEWRSESDGNVISINIYICANTAIYKGVGYCNILYEPILNKQYGL